MIEKITKIALMLVVILFSSCQFNKVFLQATPIKHNFNKIKGLTINNKDYLIERDSINSSFSIVRNNIKINKNHEIKPIEFLSKSGNQLFGLLLTPKKNIRKDLIFLHFHGRGANILNHYHKIKRLTEKGFQVFTFDYSGFGFSKGEATRKNTLKDAYSALDFIKKSKYFTNKKIILFGQSYGGYLASIVGSNRQEDIDGLIIEGAFYSHKKEAIYKSGFFANLVYDGIRADKEIIKNKKPLLVIHSKDDKVTPIEFSQRLYKKANQPKYFMEINKKHLEGLNFYSESIKNKIEKIFKK